MNSRVRFPKRRDRGRHPDDIEFYMAGTLLLFKQAGYEIHYMP